MRPEASIFIGNSRLHTSTGDVQGEFAFLRGEDYYKISHVDQMAPFFMTIVSASDQWMFMSSNGALTAGRRNREHALFPYYTDDKIHDSVDLTGSKSIFLVQRENRRYLWEPFSSKYEGVYHIERHLYKSKFSDKIVFEEYNKELGLTFSYSLTHSNRYGLVKESHLVNKSDTSVHIQLIDGVQNLLPYGVTFPMQTELSTLIDAYKKNELEQETGLGIFRLSSILVDRPEPSEALKATTVWAAGIEQATYLLSSTQLDRFRRGEKLTQETDIRAERGAFFVNGELLLAAKEAKQWYMVADIEQDHSAITALSIALQDRVSLVEALNEDLKEGAEALAQIVACADGLQLTADRLSNNRHAANVLFNVMRGGIFDDHYTLGKEDFQAFFLQFNAPLAAAHADFLDALPESLSITDLVNRAQQHGDSDLIRMCYEYLPLIFSRRHGDPSRPWNFFSIEIQEADGSKMFNYQGNWRDIFQNWEALCTSYPSFTESIICKFVNASTADGYNPYRITRAGIDWEDIDPNDPWSYIGYWGDHQIIYLQKLLEMSRDHHPDLLTRFLNQDIFVYAYVPYTINSFEDILKDPHNTIVYDHDAEAQIKNRVAKVGADGKLIWAKDETIYHVNLTEKLLVMALAKLSNFIPEAGIWMNTQRPEWNDANNALVGYGVSMVTLCYLRRFQLFCKQLFSQAEEETFLISKEVALMLQEISQTFDLHTGSLEGPISDKERHVILSGLGKAGSKYRLGIYQDGFSGEKSSIHKGDILRLIDLSLRYIDHCIRANKRADHLYHAYNLMSAQGDTVKIRTLYEMLEGQVAVLSAGFLSTEESLAVLDALKASALYREDQYSYLLYPNRKLPRFTQKNQIPAQKVEQSSLLQTLIKVGNHDLITCDAQGVCHFNGVFRNADSVNSALQDLTNKGFASEVEQDGEMVLSLFEEMFDHQSFTGRSGTFFGYEGLGSIYWHMVSKLLLAVCEVYYRAVEQGDSAELRGKLVEHYYDIRAGIGLNKNPSVYGAFPTDPYSHTPGHAGAQQPGMTGQVKEDILSRMGELGLVIRAGKIHFEPILLRKEEFLSEAQAFHYYGYNGQEQVLDVPKDALAFTYCQVPILYRLSDTERIDITFLKEGNQQIDGHILSEEFSDHLFSRDGSIQQIDVYLKPRL